MARPAIHPGEHLAAELEALDMSAAELARNIHVPTDRITQILNGRRAITGDMFHYGREAHKPPWYEGSMAWPSRLLLPKGRPWLSFCYSSFAGKK